MAAGKIVIEHELRPCIVSGREKGLFHGWEKWQEPIGESPMVGGHCAGQISRTYALVEDESGQINRYEPSNVRFVDNKINDYCFGG